MTYKRNCPTCNKEIIYNNKNNCLTSEKKKRKCFECGIKYRKSFFGKDNPFYGKKHSDKTKKMISEFNSEKRVLSEEFLQKARENLAKVSNKRWLYDIWLEKYGLEEANKRLDNFKKKQSINSSGSKNPMFGKPSPEGSGNGWSGWYKNWYFRSLRELSYMINVIEAQNLSWKTSDKLIKILYIDFAGKTRNYFPDFIINNSHIVEIKPIKLHNTPKVLAKKLATEKFCIENNMTYEIIDPIILKEEEIKTLYINKEIIFIEKYDDKFKKKYL